MLSVVCSCFGGGRKKNAPLSDISQAPQHTLPRGLRNAEAADRYSNPMDGLPLDDTTVIPGFDAEEAGIDFDAEADSTFDSEENGSRSREADRESSCHTEHCIELLPDSDNDSDDGYGDQEALEYLIDARGFKHRAFPRNAPLHSTDGSSRHPNANTQAVTKLISDHVEAVMDIDSGNRELMMSNPDIREIYEFLLEPLPEHYEIDRQNLQILWRYAKFQSKKRFEQCSPSDVKLIHEQIEGLMDIDQENRKAVMGSREGRELYIALLSCVNEDWKENIANLKLFWRFMKKLSDQRIQMLVDAEDTYKDEIKARLRINGLSRVASTHIDQEPAITEARSGQAEKHKFDLHSYVQQQIEDRVPYTSSQRQSQGH